MMKKIGTVVTLWEFRADIFKANDTLPNCKQLGAVCKGNHRDSWLAYFIDSIEGNS